MSFGKVNWCRWFIGNTVFALVLITTGLALDYRLRQNLTTTPITANITDIEQIQRSHLDGVKSEVVLARIWLQFEYQEKLYDGAIEMYFSKNPVHLKVGDNYSAWAAFDGQELVTVSNAKPEIHPGFISLFLVLVGIAGPIGTTATLYINQAEQETKAPEYTKLPQKEPEEQSSISTSSNTSSSQ